MSWASIDYYGCWKAGHYAAQQFHNDPIITLKENITFGSYDIIVVSDVDINGSIHVQFMSMNGTILDDMVYDNVKVFKNSSKLVDSVKFN